MKTRVPTTQRSVIRVVAIVSWSIVLQIATAQDRNDSANNPVDSSEKSSLSSCINVLTSRSETTGRRITLGQRKRRAARRRLSSSRATASRTLRTTSSRATCLLGEAMQPPVAPRSTSRSAPVGRTLLWQITGEMNEASMPCNRLPCASQNQRPLRHLRTVLLVPSLISAIRVLSGWRTLSTMAPQAARYLVAIESDSSGFDSTMRPMAVGDEIGSNSYLQIRPLVA